jgi:hypothetical protein
VRSYYQNAVCIPSLTCSKSQPYDDSIELKNTAVWILYKVELNIYLFIANFVAQRDAQF